LGAEGGIPVHQLVRFVKRNAAVAQVASGAPASGDY
jgi:hypothetical protein